MKWIVTDDIYAETWRRVLEFGNLDLTVDEITRRHGQPTQTSERLSYRKQAQQVRVAILQAKEYFEAARQSSLYTSANHLYYGITSLATATMLVLGDGTRSLDFLRRDSKNGHHGLHFTTGCTAKEAATGLALIKKSFVEVLPRGHFANWYSTLPLTESALAYHVREVDGGSVTSRETLGGHRLAPLEEIKGRKFSTVDLLRRFPDLVGDLPQYGISVAQSRATHKVEFKRNGRMRHIWLIHGAPDISSRDELLEKFRLPSRFIGAMAYHIQEDALGGIVVLDCAMEDQEITFEWPNCRETMSHDTIFYAEDYDTLEIADGFLASYQLSMLSRYFPDLWVACLESQCKAAKLIERAVDILLKKFPILALSLLVPEGVVVSTHREPWKSW